MDIILFEEDWKRFPTAIADYETSNQSFVRLSSIYRSMGVKNHAFLLALVNPDLKGVDPYDPNLTTSQMVAIALECQVNPWYFFRECVRVPPAAGTIRVPLEANRGNIALFWCFFCHVMVFLIQPRQTGKSFNSDIIDCYLLNIGCQNTQINLLTKDDQLRRKNIERLRNIIKEIPQYLNQITKADSSNFEEITVRKLGNTYNTHVPQSSEKAAYKLGRGLTTAIMKIDEGPFQPNVEIAVGSALGATGAAVDAAKANNTFYGTVFTTTAGKLNDDSGKYMFDLISDSTIWDEKFFDCKDEEDLNRVVKKHNHGRNYRMNLTFNHRQLGKTDQWLFEKISESTQKGEDADRDYFNRWTTGTVSNPIDKIYLNLMSETQRTHDYAHISPPYDNMTLWYIPANQIATRMNSGKFVMGLDTSDGGKGDGIAMVVTDVETLEVICTGTFNELNLIEFTYWLVDMLVSFPNITLVIERRSSAITMIDYLLKQLPVHGIDPFKRLFNTLVQHAVPNSPIWNMLKTPVGRRSPHVYIEHKAAFGFTTTGSGMGSRSELYGTTLQKAVKLGSGVIYDIRLVNQLGSLITKNGRVDHPPGGHDDSVIAWLLCNWFVTQGNNLSFYGINSVLTRVKVDTATGIAKIIDKRDDEQIYLREEVTKLYEKLDNCNDDFLSMRYEQQLRHLDKQLVMEDGEDWTVDSLMKRIKEKKTTKYNTASRFRDSDRTFVNTHTGYSNKPMAMAEFM